MSSIPDGLISHEIEMKNTWPFGREDSSSLDENAFTKMEVGLEKNAHNTCGTKLEFDDRENSNKKKEEEDAGICN